MKIGVIGATGKAGSLIVKEASERGHEVTAIVRNPAKLAGEKVAVLEKDVFELKAEDLEVFDVVVNTFGAPAGREHLHVDAGRVLIEAIKGAPETKLIVVGGAGSLFVDEAQTVRLIETPEFPKEYFPTASNQGKNQRICKMKVTSNGRSSAPRHFSTQKEKERVPIKKEKTISS